MAHCINKSNKGYKDLLKLSGLKDVVLAARIAIWQRNNNKMDTFPTLKELNITDNNKSTSVAKQKIAPEFQLQKTLKAQYQQEGLIDSRGNVKDYAKLMVRNREITEELAAAHNIPIELRERVYTLSGDHKQFATLNHSFLNKINSKLGLIKKEDNKLRKIVNENQANSFQNDKYSAEFEEYLLKNKKYFIDGESTSKDILEKIAKSDHSLNKLAKHLVKFTQINNVKIKVVSEIPSEGLIVKSAGDVYDSNTNTISISAKLDENNKKYESIILHEILHSLTYTALRQDTETSNTFNNLFEKAKNAFSAYNRETQTGTYATLNTDEFLVALFTDPKFIIELSKVPSEKTKFKNLFEEIYDYILALLKISKSSNLYKEAFAVATNTLEEFKQSTEASKDYNQISDIVISPTLKEYFKNVKQTPEITRLISEIDKILPQYPAYDINSLVGLLIEVPEFTQDLQNSPGTRFPYVNLHKELSTVLLQAKGVIPNTEAYYEAMEMFGYENKPFIFTESLETDEEVENRNLENLLQDIKNGLPNTPILRPEFRTYFNPPLLLKRAQFPLEDTQKYVDSFNNIQETLGKRTFSKLENFKEYSKEEWSGILLYALEQALRQDVNVSVETINKIKDFIKDRYVIRYDTVVQYNNTPEIWEVAENMEQFIKFKKEYPQPENTEELIKDFREFAQLEQSNINLECL